MSKPKCKCAEVECEECPEWIFTLADLIMCMMGLFVILWVLKPGMTTPVTASAAETQADDWFVTVGEIRRGFGWEPDPQSSDPVDKAIIRRRNAGKGAGGETLVPRNGAEGTDPEVTTIRFGPLSTIGGKLVFEPGDAVLSAPAKTALAEIAVHIRGHRNIVLIKGHTATDDLAQGATPQAKMDLSLRRAQAAADHLIGLGVAAEILRVQGCSTFEPVSQRAYTLQQQLLNRRVEVDVTATLVPELQDSNPSAKPASSPQTTRPGPPSIPSTEPTNH